MTNKNHGRAWLVDDLGRHGEEEGKLCPIPSFVLLFIYFIRLLVIANRSLNIDLFSREDLCMNSNPKKENSVKCTNEIDRLTASMGLINKRIG